MVNVGKYTYQSNGCVTGGGLQVNEQDVSLLWPLFPRRGLNTLQNMIIPLASMYGIFTYIYHKNQPFM